MSFQLNNRQASLVHPGLLLDKLGLHHLLLANEELSEELTKPRKSVFKAASKAYSESRIDSLYNDFLDEWLETVNSWGENAVALKARLEYRLAIGLGAAAAMNTGITLHHTYGVPVIPGSSVKGTCREAARLNGAKAERIIQLYGPEPAKGVSEGEVVFFDALPLGLRPLELDIITPHHQNYYAGKNSKYPEFYKAAPDVEDPVPVFFLTVPSGTEFLFVFLSRKGEKHDLAEVKRHWQWACDEGFGAKTSRGYGWFTPLS
jgi:CRISPR-associated protein Cmr6